MSLRYELREVNYLMIAWSHCIVLVCPLNHRLISWIVNWYGTDSGFPSGAAPRGGGGALEGLVPKPEGGGIISSNIWRFFSF